MFPMTRNQKGQTAMEYVFLIAGSLLFVTLILLALRGGVFMQGGQRVNETTNSFLDLYGKNYVFFDNFDSGSADQWEPVSGTWAVENKEYAQLEDSAEYLSLAKKTGSNFSYQGRFRKDNAGYASLVFRAQNATYYYEFSVERGVAYFYEHASGTTQTLAQAPFPLTGPPYSGTLRVDAYGTAFTFYVDGTPVFGGPVSDSTFSEGQFGAATDGAGFFDDLKACPQAC